MFDESFFGRAPAADEPAWGAELRFLHRLARHLKAEREQVRGKLGRLSGRFAVRLLRAAKPPHGDAFRVLLDGLMENRAVSMEYESPYKAGKSAASAGAAGKARKNALKNHGTTKSQKDLFAKKG